MTRTIKNAVAIVVIALAVDPYVQAGTNVYVGTNVAADRQVSIDQIDHSAWDAILHKYVNDDGMVDYRSLKESPSDMEALEGYLADLSTANPQLAASREAKLAFWINAYNAVTVRGILREYPTSSIRNHTAKLFGYNIWKDLQLYVGGEQYSLDEIEHVILRKMGEPRIHFAIVCAAKGCPRLLNEAYVASRLEEQLETNARDFFARPQNFHFDRRNGRFYLSSILSWFGGNFGADQAAQLRTIAPWLPDEASRQAARKNAVSIRYLDYDWSLNEHSEAT